ncbi:serine hydrolase domain-containing protein [Streptococcus pacificus]|uniref:Beta-lactamase family protein n=1 Tax=Streptococcus pacificus TaxID=2740577 RepID=A0ABS0ZK32_9STRE|nr:serine hydrolase domain-containing protein [Streptococcus pacificus]MBJ8326248.1 beta-lactamase family protein [Streptococcus pacificus]
MSHDTIIEKITEQISDNLYLGASLAIYDKEWKEYYLGETVPGVLTKEDLSYDLASVSKVVGVGTLMIYLINEGTFKLDVPFKTYYPFFNNDQVTIRQLLTHTSGIDPFIANRDKLGAEALKEAIHQIKVTDNKDFLYTDINFLLLGFLLEYYYQESLDKLFNQKLFQPLGMTKTGFSPKTQSVPTSKTAPKGLVHDPKARVLGVHSGSAGLFSTLKDLEIFMMHNLTGDFAKHLTKGYALANKERSLAWNLNGYWLDHTGYTGPFIMFNRETQQAVIFLTNRTYLYDDRPLWIAKRRELRDVMISSLAACDSL